MKKYPEIQGPSKAPRLPCIAFEKLDGSNMRAEWSKKRGWYKFGSRNMMIDKTHEMFGSFIDCFMQKYAKDLERIFKSEYRNIQSIVVFCEYFGQNSFAGIHNPEDLRKTGNVILFDVSLHNYGIIPPDEFIKVFKSVEIPRIIYRGNFNDELVNDVKFGKYNVYEGVVAKGKTEKNKQFNNGLWLAKVKTAKWVADLKNRAMYEDRFKPAVTNYKQDFEQ